MTHETWEIAARRIIKENDLVAGYSYDCSYCAGCKDVHEKDTIPVYLPDTINDVCVGTIYGSYGEIDIYGHQYVEIMEKLADALKKEMDISYELTLKEEEPRIKGWGAKYLFPYLDLWAIGCLGVSIFVWIGIMFCYCFILVLIRGLS